MRVLGEDTDEDRRVARRLRPEADPSEEGTVGDEAAPSLECSRGAEEVLVARQALEDVAEVVVRDVAGGVARDCDGWICSVGLNSYVNCRRDSTVQKKNTTCVFGTSQSVAGYAHTFVRSLFSGERRPPSRGGPFLSRATVLAGGCICQRGSPGPVDAFDQIYAAQMEAQILMDVLAATISGLSCVLDDNWAARGGPAHTVPPPPTLPVCGDGAGELPNGLSSCTSLGHSSPSILPPWHHIFPLLPISRRAAPPLLIAGLRRGGPRGTSSPSAVSSPLNPRRLR